jgi:hypothetical protein
MWTSRVHDGGPGLGASLGITPVRRGSRSEILAHDIDTAGRLVAVEILLRVTRGADDRLDGSARISGDNDVREFSGMLELMRVFEELVPAPALPADADAGNPPPGTAN